MSVTGIMLVSVFAIPLGGDSNGSMVGFASDVQPSSNGFTFNFEDSDDNVFRCFSSSNIREGVCKIKGSFSSNGSMFFVESIEYVEMDRVLTSQYN